MDFDTSNIIVYSKDIKGKLIVIQDILVISCSVEEHRRANRKPSADIIDVESMIEGKNAEEQINYLLSTLFGMKPLQNKISICKHTLQSYELMTTSY